MATITLKNELKITTSGELPANGTILSNLKGVKGDLSEVKIEDYRGKNVILNFFPSVDTGVCATSVRRFNKETAGMNDTVVLCISKDLPFAQGRFCGAEGIENVVMVSAFRCSCIEKECGNLMADGPLAGLFARSIIVLDKEGKVVYSELVPEVTQEPNYEKALAAIK